MLELHWEWTEAGVSARATTLVMDFMICFLDSVHIGQFTKKNHSELFVRSNRDTDFFGFLEL